MEFTFTEKLKIGFVLFNNLEFQPDGCLLLSSVEVDFNHKSIDIT